MTQQIINSETQNVRPVTFTDLYSLNKPQLYNDKQEPFVQSYQVISSPCINGMGMGADATSNVNKFQGGYQYNVNCETEGAISNPNSGIWWMFNFVFRASKTDAVDPQKSPFGKKIYLEKDCMWKADVYNSDAGHTTRPYVNYTHSRYVSSGIMNSLAMIKKATFTCDGKTETIQDVYRKVGLIQRTIPNEVQKTEFPFTFFDYDGAMEFDLRYTNVSQHGNIEKWPTSDGDGKVNVSAAMAATDWHFGCIASHSDAPTGSPASRPAIIDWYQKNGWTFDSTYIYKTVQKEVFIPFNVLLPFLKDQYFQSAAFLNTTKTISVTLYPHTDRYINDLFGAQNIQQHAVENMQVYFRDNVTEQNKGELGFSALPLFYNGSVTFTNSYLQQGTLKSAVAGDEVVQFGQIKSHYIDIERTQNIPTGGSNTNHQNYNIEVSHKSCNTICIGPVVNDEGLDSSNMILGRYSPYINSQLVYFYNMLDGRPTNFYHFGKFNIMIGSNANTHFSEDTTAMFQLYTETLRSLNASNQYSIPLSMSFQKFFLHYNMITVNLERWHTQSDMDIIQDGFDSTFNKLAVRYEPGIFGNNGRTSQGNMYFYKCTDTNYCQPPASQSIRGITNEIFTLYDKFLYVKPGKTGNAIAWSESAGM